MSATVCIDAEIIEMARLDRKIRKGRSRVPGMTNARHPDEVLEERGGLFRLFPGSLPSPDPNPSGSLISAVSDLDIDPMERSRGGSKRLTDSLFGVGEDERVALSAGLTLVESNHGGLPEVGPDAPLAASGGRQKTCEDEDEDEIPSKANRRLCYRLMGDGVVRESLGPDVGETALVSPRRIQKPIILIGAGRSGTSLLGAFVASHPDVAFLPEPRPIWMYGNAYRSDQALDASHLTPKIAEFIDRRFGEFLEESGRSRFAEKTPSNCLRIPFIHALYPDCRIVHVLRDGLDVVRSTVSIGQRPANPGTLRSRMRSTPWWEWPSYLPTVWNTFVRTNLLGRPARYWGAKPPGWKEWQHLPPHLSAAHQWRSLVEISIREIEKLPAESSLEIRYEEVIEDAGAVCDRIAEFAEVPPSEEMRRAARERVKPGHATRRRGELTKDQEDEVLEIIGSVQRNLGYPISPISE